MSHNQEMTVKEFRFGPGMVVATFVGAGPPPDGGHGFLFDPVRESARAALDASREAAGYRGARSELAVAESRKAEAARRLAVARHRHQGATAAASFDLDRELSDAEDADRRAAALVERFRAEYDRARRDLRDAAHALWSAARQGRVGELERLAADGRRELAAAAQPHVEALAATEAALGIIRVGGLVNGSDDAVRRLVAEFESAAPAGSVAAA